MVDRDISQHMLLFMLTVPALCDIGPHGANTQGQYLCNGHNVIKCWNSALLCWKSTMCALEQCHMDICPMSLCIGQTLDLHMGFALLKMFFQKLNLTKLDLNSHGTDFNFWHNQIIFMVPKMCTTTVTAIAWTNMDSTITQALGVGPLGPS